MKRFTFRLARVVRVRQIERDRAQAEWVLARNSQATLEAELSDLRAQAAAEASGIGVGAVQSSDDIRAAAFRATLRARAAEFAMDDLAEAVKVTEAKASVLTQATQRVEALERLEIRHREEWVADNRRAEAVNLDDIATTRAARTGLGALR